MGAGKWHMVRTVVLPNSVDGIITGCILAVGRIVGESAALLYTAGFGLVLNGFITSLESSSASLTVAPMYMPASGARLPWPRHRHYPDAADPGHQFVRQPGGPETKKVSGESHMSTIIEVKDLNLWYGTHHALYSVNIAIPEHEITALIGPSGCGKSTFLKTLNRMNDLIPGIRIEGEVQYGGENV